MWEIVSFGDVVTLQGVFNSIAAIFSNSTYKAATVAVALFAVVAVVASSVSEAKPELPIPKLLAGLLMYVMGFGTLTNVSIENRYDGTVTAINNIPVAIAIPASLISNVGLKLAEITETAHGSVNEHDRVTQRGYLSPLRILAAYRNSATVPCPAGYANSSINGYDFCPSFHNYIRDCTMVKAKRDGLTQVVKESSLEKAIEFNSNAFATVLHTSRGTREELSCKDGYTKIKGMFASGDFDKMLTTFNSEYGVKVGEDVVDTAQGAMLSIGADAAQARNLLKTVMANALMEDGELAFYNKNGASDYAENLMSSIEQRNYGWLMQGEAWIQMVNKFITIIECLLYAITPFIGLMVLFGSIGSKTLLLYLQMLGAIQLVPTLLVITQNIIMTDMQRAIVMITNQYEIGSVAYVHAVFEEAKELLGFGGMMAASFVPALAMSLVTGSGMAVMGAFKGAAAPAKDTDAVPNIATTGGAMQDYGNMNSGKVNAFGDTWTQSSKDLTGDVVRQASASTSVQDSKTKMEQAQKSYQEARENAFQTSTGNTYTSQELLNSGRQIASGSGSVQTWAENKVTSLGEKMGLTQEEKNQLTGALTLGGMFGFLGAKGQETYTSGLSENAQKAYDQLTKGDRGDTLNAEFKDVMTAARTSGETISTGNSDLDSKAEKISQTSQEVESTTDQWQSAKSAQDTASFINKNSEMAIHKMGSDEGYQSYLTGKILENKDNEDWMRLFSERQKQFDGGVDGTDLSYGSATVAAYLATNNELGMHSENQEALSNYKGYQTTPREDLRAVNAGQGIKPESELPKTPEHGEINRQNIEGPQRGTVPTEFKGTPMDEKFVELYSGFLNNSDKLDNHENSFGEREEFQEYQEALDKARNNIDKNEGAEVVPFQNTKDFLQDAIASGNAGSLEHQWETIERVFRSNDALNFLTDKSEDLVGAILNGYGAAREAYYSSPMGEFENSLFGTVNEKFEGLNNAIEGGNKAEIEQATIEYMESTTGLLNDINNNERGGGNPPSGRDSMGIPY